MPCDEVRLQPARVVLVQRAADDLLHLAVVEVDARPEERPALSVGHSSQRVTVRGDGIS